MFGGIDLALEIFSARALSLSLVVHLSIFPIREWVLLSQRESFVSVKIFESKILMNFDVFEVPESE